MYRFPLQRLQQPQWSLGSENIGVSMKAILISLMSLVMSSSAFASGAKYICKETGVKPGYNKRTVVLTQFGDAEVKEGKTYAFGFQVFDGVSKKPTLSTKVFVQTEDVLFAFGNREEAISGMIYLDEMDQASVEIAGEKLSLNCD